MLVVSHTQGQKLQSLFSLRMLWKDNKIADQPLPQGFSLKKQVGPHQFFEEKALGTRLIEDVCSMRCRRFRAVSEQRTRKESQRPREKWLSSHFSCGQNRQSRSSVYLCYETKRTRLLHRLRCMSHGGCSEQKSNVYFPYRYRFVLKEISIQKTNAVIQCWSMVFLFQGSNEASVTPKLLSFRASLILTFRQASPPLSFGSSHEETGRVPERKRYVVSPLNAGTSIDSKEAIILMFPFPMLL